jgi:hypothetical protein
MPDTLIAITAPGTNAMIFEPGTTIRVLAGSSLPCRVHYTTNGKEVTDQSPDTSIPTAILAVPPALESCVR